jgi:hypothetical protein
VWINPAVVSLVREGLQANPAYVSLAKKACHMVAASIFLDICMAIRTLFHTVLLTPLGQRRKSTSQIILVFGTAHSVVIFDVACRAYMDQAGRALQCRPHCCWTIYHFAIWRWAIFEIGWVLVDVGEEGSMEERVFLGGGQ